MIVRDDTVVLSASDLKAAIECEWALMRRLDARLGRVAAVPDPEDPMNRRAAHLGDAHEVRQLDEYVDRFGLHVPGAPGGVAMIDRVDSRDVEAVRVAQERTLAAVHDAADVVFQAALAQDDFVGFADFLLRTERGTWAVVDTKLARRARVTALLQLAAYAGRLEALGVPVDEHVHLLLGDGSVSTHRLVDVQPVFAVRMARLRSLVEARRADDEPVRWGAEGVAACGRCAECAAQVETSRDVLLVGRLTVLQRAKLHAAGITTIDAFAAGTGPVDGIGPAALQRLRRQAVLQLRAEERAGDGQHRVEAEVIDPEGLAALPRPDAGDVFFDFEGDPLWTDDQRQWVGPHSPVTDGRGAAGGPRQWVGPHSPVTDGRGAAGGPRQWGLEYLFGSVVVREGREVFRPFWAHDRAQEKQALLGFLHWIRDRRTRYPGMHVYHYADYERSHLQQLCARHGVGEAMLDELLREHVLVDLYPVVLRSVRVSERSYGLKKLEPLYMGDRLRESDVTTGADSVDAYVEYTRLAESGDGTAADAQLQQIADYNEYDCASTKGLRDWLLALADERGVPRRPPLPAEPESEARLVRRQDEARTALLATIEDVPRAERTPAQTAVALAAAAIEYHRRESKTFWWEHFNREIAPIDDWAETKDVLVLDPAESRVAEGWVREGARRSDRRVLRLVGAVAAGSGLKPGDRCFLMYDDPVPAGCDPVPQGQRGENPHGQLRDVRLLADGRIEVHIEEQAGQRDGAACEPWPHLPIALTPAPPPNTAALREAILTWGEQLAADPGRRDAVLDLLRREPPHLAGGDRAGARDPGADHDTASAVVSELLRLDGSYLAVQGPPGSGKTHLGAAVVTRLVQDHGWRIGVVAQSHAVVENLLDRAVAAGLDADLVGKRVGPSGTVGDWTAIAPTPAAATQLWARSRRESGFLLGGTAWTFSNERQVPRGDLDLLVVDEAGQFSLANTIAAGVSARNLLLLGDPQQLPQVSQGLHPEPVDESALGWVSAGHDVLPAAFGVFLAESWRMHPALTAAVSDLSYEGRLGARLPVTTERRLTGIAPGLHPVPLHHDGDSIESAAEADAVVEIVRSHLGLRWTDPSCGRVADPLQQRDLIVVAPFNAQVALIRARLDDAGLQDVPVGTVDRFQGQQAVVAIVSLTASSSAEVPRGIGFVLSRNRLNVAISRAQWASYLLHSPSLADHVPRDAVGVAELSAFLRLTTAVPRQAVPSPGR